MKKFALLLLSLFLTLTLSGCFSTEEPVDLGLVLPTENYSFYKGEGFEIQYPIDWVLLEKKDINAKFKENLEVAFMSNFKDLFFTPVITVEKTKSQANSDNQVFAESVINKNAATLIDYNVIEKQTVSTSVNGAPALATLVVFEGKEKLQDDKLEYIQIYLSKAEVGYIATGAYDPTDNKIEPEKIVDSLRTFKLK
jgi:hypothetical protein